VLLPGSNHIKEEIDQKGKLTHSQHFLRQPAQGVVDPHHTHASNVQLVRLYATNVPRKDTFSLYVNQAKKWQQSKQLMMMVNFWVL